MKLKSDNMNTPNPWDEGYKVFKDEYTKEEIDKMTLSKIIPLLSSRTEKPSSYYWDMIYNIWKNPRNYKAGV